MIEIILLLRCKKRRRLWEQKEMNMHQIRRRRVMMPKERHKKYTVEQKLRYKSIQEEGDNEIKRDDWRIIFSSPTLFSCMTWMPVVSWALLRVEMTSSGSLFRDKNSRTTKRSLNVGMLRMLVSWLEWKRNEKVWLTIDFQWNSRRDKEEKHQEKGGYHWYKVGHFEGEKSCKEHFSVIQTPIHRRVR